jgi:hypothetical protein
MKPEMLLRYSTPQPAKWSLSMPSAPVRVCLLCGHPIPSPAVAAAFVGRERQLVEIVANAGADGIGTPRILDQLYSSDPAGGPESSNIVAVMVKRINRRLAQHGMAIRGRRGGHYRLIAIGGDQ